MPWAIQLTGRPRTYFQHELPATASGWQNEKLKKLLERDGVARVVSHMHAFGMVQEDERGEGLRNQEPTAHIGNCGE